MATSFVNIVFMLVAALATSVVAAKAEEPFTLMLMWKACECTKHTAPNNATAYACKAQAVAQDAKALIASDGSVDFTVTEDKDHGTASWTSVAIIASDGTYSEKGNVTFGKAAVGSESHTFHYESIMGGVKPKPGGSENTAGLVGKVVGGSGYFNGATGFFSYTERYSEDFSVCEIYSSTTIVR